MKVQTYVRKQFPVQAVEVTAENMKDVAEWCGGKIQPLINTGASVIAEHIKVRATSPRTPRQTQAFVGDYVLKSPMGTKVYTEKAFRNSFELKEEVEVVELPEGGISFNADQELEDKIFTAPDDASSLVTPGDEKEKSPEELLAELEDEEKNDG